MADEGTAPDTEDKTRRSVEAFKDDQPIALGPTWTLASALNLPATTALLLALLYGVGAFTRSAELKNAGVPVNVALPLVPLTQDLARGIQVVVEPTVLLVGLLLVVALVILDADPTADKPKVSLASGRSKVAVALLVLLGVALLILAPYVAGSVVIAVVAVILVLALSAPEGHRISVVTKVRLGPRYRASTAVLAASVAVGLASAAVVLELLHPPLLPAATLTLRDGRVMHGDLITIADGLWYLTVPGRGGHITTVNTSDVSGSEVVGRARTKLGFNEDLFQVIKR